MILDEIGFDVFLVSVRMNIYSFVAITIILSFFIAIKQKLEDLSFGPLFLFH